MAKQSRVAKKTNQVCRFHRGASKQSIAKLFFALDLSFSVDKCIINSKTETYDRYTCLLMVMWDGPKPMIHQGNENLLALTLSNLMWFCCPSQEIPWSLPPFFAVTAGNAQLTSVQPQDGTTGAGMRRNLNLAKDFLKEIDHTKMCVSLNLSMEVLFGIYWNWGKPQTPRIEILKITAYITMQTHLQEVLLC